MGCLLEQVVSRLQLLSAVFKATLTAVNGALRTPNVHSEIVCAMSSSNNVMGPLFLSHRFFELTYCPDR